MNKLQLDFLHCYADVYNKQNEDIFNVIEECKSELHNVSYMEEFIDSYKEMKYWGLEVEIKHEINNGNTFLGACIEWDVLCVSDYYIEKEY